LRQHRNDLEKLTLEVVVVTFEARETAEQYVRETGLPWPLLIDPRRALYRAYGMCRGPWSAIWGPASWWAYARLIARGHRPRRPTGDVRQLGGDVLIDPAGSVALHHVGHGPADRPAVSAILEHVKRGPRVA
jgi:alkyl-hydroperoxide reductase/thiol specific antioxidant family protein